MPINGEKSGDFLGIKGENCNFIRVKGLRVLEDEFGNDLLKIIRGGISSGGASSEIKTSISNILLRLEAMEKFLQNMPNTATNATPEVIQGPPGIQGPRGAPGAKKLSELTDVNLDGLDDGAILVWSSKDKKFVVSLE
jgi:hypothetical protein